jgi:hypothetical protein
MHCRTRLSGVVASLALVALSLAGCSAGDVADVQQEADVAGQPPPTEEAPSPSVSVQIASWEQTQDLVAQQHGKVVVMDVWASW